MTTRTAIAAGDYLRHWRRRRQLSQLNLASLAQISQRHLSFLESGRASPSRTMILRLAERLEVPLRERNAMLLAAGFAPMYAERTLQDSTMAAAKAAIDRVLKGHEPYPALAVDRHWNLIAANSAFAPLLIGIEATWLLEAPVNVLRLSLHPQGLAPRIANFAEWRAHLLGRLNHQAATTGDPLLTELHRELSGYFRTDEITTHENDNYSDFGGVLVPLKLSTEAGTLSFISTTTLFGAPRDITLSELALEAFFPADAETALLMNQLQR